MTRSVAALGAAALVALTALATNLTAVSATTLVLSGDAPGTTTMVWQDAFTPPPVPYRLTADVSGDGIVLSDPTGIVCEAATCYRGFAGGTSVMLVPIFGSGSTSIAWTGCDSVTLFDECVVELTSDRSVTAVFS